MNAPRRLLLEGGSHAGSVRFLSGLKVTLGADAARNPRSTVTVTRTGSFTAPRYGRFEITRDMLLSMVRNFDARVYGQDIFLDVAHEPSKGAAAKVLGLSVEGNRLRAEVEWTPYGVDAVRNRGFAYLSAEYHENWQDNESGDRHGPLLLGGALTVRPVIKRLDPIELSEPDAGGHAVLLHPELATTLSQEIRTMWKELIKQLGGALSALKLPEGVSTQLSQTFEKSLEGITDEARAKLLLNAFQDTGKQLAEQIDQLGTKAPGTITLDFGNLDQALAAARGGGGLSADDVKKLLAEEQDRIATESKKLTESLATKVKRFSDAIENAEGLKGLSDDARGKLLAARDLITAGMSDEQVDKLAAHQIQLGNDIAVAAQLAARGFPGPAGQVHVTMDQGNAIKGLQEEMDKRLGIVGLSDAKRYERTGGVLQAQNKALAEQVLAQFDALHAAELQGEAKMLAAGDGLVSDVAVPVVWERTVIREALHNLVGLNFVDGGTETFATSYMIPYSYRDTTAAGISDTRKYEGGSIARAGVIQTAETAYNTPQKLAFEVSDELRYLTAARQLNWEAVQENQRNASRIIGEDLDRLLINEQLHASDEYGAVAVSNENLELQADDTKNIFVLASFPVVRPRAVYDLQGNQVGSTVNPITVTYDSVARAEYDGTGTQAAGIYYVLDYNLGEIYLVDEAGDIQVPANATAYTISYSYATNVYNFDTDLPDGVATDAHWDSFLYRYSLRKTVIEDDRYHMANFGLMRGAVMDQIGQAKQFAANFRRPGTDLSMDGSLGRIRDVPNFKAWGPNLWMGDRRVLMGERGVTRLRMTKPWTLGELENQKDANGRFTGKKEAYGDQFVVVHTPTQLKRALTTLNVYSATARVARAA